MVDATRELRSQLGKLLYLDLLGKRLEGAGPQVDSLETNAVSPPIFGARVHITRFPAFAFAHLLHCP